MGRVQGDKTQCEMDARRQKVENVENKENVESVESVEKREGKNPTIGGIHCNLNS